MFTRLLLYTHFDVGKRKVSIFRSLQVAKVLTEVQF